MARFLHLNQLRIAKTMAPSWYLINIATAAEKKAAAAKKQEQQEQQGTSAKLYLQKQQAEMKQAKVDMKEIIKNGTFKKQTVKQLRAFLKSQREPNGGNKDELVKRIQAMLKEK